MKARNKKGISSIVGALIFLQILAISLILVIHVINEETNTTQKSIQTFQSLAENAPIEEMTQHGITYLYSTSPFEITHVVYPNGEIINTSITVNNEYPVSKILGGYPWAIIVTNKGTYYNVTYLGGTLRNPSLITFPSYQDYGLPLDPSVLNMEFPFDIPQNNQDYPNWGVLDGIASPSAISLVPVNVTIGDPTTYSWALTDAVLVVYPNSSTGWINITYYNPIMDGSYTINPGPGALLSPFGWNLYDVYVSGLATVWANFEWYQSNGTIGVYIPLNVSAAIATGPYPTGSFNLPPSLDTVENITVYQYSFIYIGNTEVSNFHYGGVFLNSPQMSAWTYTQIGTCDIENTLYYFPSYLISSNPQNIFGINVMPIDFPPINWYSSNSYFNYKNFNWDTVHTNFDNTLGVHAISGQQYPIQVFQVDINLHKGEVLDYGYYSSNNSWLLLYNWAFNYNNQSLYREAVENLGPLSGEYYGHTAPVFIDNINNIEYLTEYPVYIVVPPGVYLLQVSTS